jgi:uncharacterized coiled-coil DUF342 family protein
MDELINKIDSILSENTSMIALNKRIDLLINENKSLRMRIAELEDQLEVYHSPIEYWPASPTGIKS